MRREGVFWVMIQDVDGHIAGIRSERPMDDASPSKDIAKVMARSVLIGVEPKDGSPRSVQEVQTHNAMLPLVSHPNHETRQCRRLWKGEKVSKLEH